MKKGTWPGNVAGYGQKIYKHLDLLETFWFYYKYSRFINNNYKSLPSSHFPWQGNNLWQIFRIRPQIWQAGWQLPVSFDSDAKSDICQNWQTSKPHP